MGNAKWIIQETTDLTEPSNTRKIHTASNAYTGNERAHEWRVKVRNDGADVQLEGYSVVATFIRPDNATVYVDGHVEGAEAVVTLSPECYAISGYLKGIMNIVKDSESISIREITMTVEIGNTGEIGGIGESTTISEIVDLMGELSGLVDNAESIIEAVENAESVLGAIQDIEEDVQEAVDKINGLTVTSETRAPGAGATAEVNVVDGAFKIHFGMPRGYDGDGAGDMVKADYDANNDGIVDNSERLGGNLPDYYVPTTLTINEKPLNANINLTSADLGAVPTTRTVNNKPLSTNISLSASDVGSVALVNGKADPTQTSATTVAVTGNYSLSLSDAGKQIEVNAASDVVITIPADADVAFPVGTEIEIVQEGAGKVTISPASGVTLHSLEDMREIAGQYGVVALKKRAANDWRLAGALA